MINVEVNKFINRVEFDYERNEPITIEINSKEDFNKLISFCYENNIEYIDNITEQIDEYKEVFKLFHKGLDDEFNLLIDRHRNPNSKIIGNIIFLGWAQKSIINVLPAEMHYELITWRNKEKITNEEQAIVSQKKIGIVGCSVGSFAVRVLGKLGFQNFNIAELKKMKPSNAPRMYHDSIRNYGKHKMEPLSNGMFEFNPYSKIKLYNDGLSSGQMDEFFTIEGEKIDILVDAADDGKIKLQLRDYCREKKIPLVSGFDEKGVLLILRYDKPDLLVEDHFDFNETTLEALKENDPNEYSKKILDFFPGGRSNLSLRQKDTIDGIMNKTRGGFSQLAWEASLFSSYVAKSILDISLGYEIGGSKFFDFDELITNQMVLKDSKAG